MSASRITPFLWFNRNATEAVDFYVATIPDSKVIRTTYYAEGTPMPAGTVLTVEFEMGGQPFVALNTGRDEAPNTAVSLYFDCKDQKEIDTLWEALSADGGKPIACGWIQDKFGFAWQIATASVVKMMTDPDPIKATRAAKAIGTMTKIDIGAMEKAFHAE